MIKRSRLMKLRGERFLLIWALFAMSRPTQLVLIAFVYLFGSIIALANGALFTPDTFLMGLVALIPLSASVHYANEYADYETDAQTIRTPFSGGSGALLRTGLPRIFALRAAWGAAILGALITLIAFDREFLTPSAIWILTLGTFFGWMYSLKPLALGWRGFGELDNALLGGVLLPLYGYVVQAGKFDAWVFTALLPFGASAFINLLATTWPDREADEAVGKRTLATRLPVQYLRLLYWSVAVGIVLSLLLLLHRILPLSVVAGSLLTAPVILWGGLRYTRQHSPLPTVAAMVLLLFAQTIAWWSTVDFCCLIGPI
jgi:1,4-dihydroxy-2-naphthoate octaprenyltransferase